MSTDASTPSVHEPVAAAGAGLVIDPEAVEVETVAGRRRRWPVRVLAAVVVLGFGYYAINLIQVWMVGNSDQKRSVDAIVVMGAAQYNGRPSPQLQARLDHVVELWDQGLAPLVVVTGGNQPGDQYTEAGASAEYLTRHGVSSGAILEENRGHTSWDSLHSVAAMLRARGATRVLLVSDPFHSLRIRLIAQQLGLTAYVSPTRTSPVKGAIAFGKEIKEAAGIAVGRIIGFDRLLAITG